jgi:hypothetical protein
MPLPAFKIVTATVDFDDEPRRVADEIRNELAHRRLTSESQSINVMRFEITPQQSFGANHRLPKLLGTIALPLAYLCVRHLETPLPTLPHKGGGSRLCRASR